jgi:hypothetical protein
VSLEQGPLSLMRTTEELFERKSSGSSQETEITAMRIPSLTSGGRSVGIVRSRTKAMEFFCFLNESTNAWACAVREF